VSDSSECRVLSCRGLCEESITCSEETYRVHVRVSECDQVQEKPLNPQ
jgi:hypothetical protein